MFSRVETHVRNKVNVVANLSFFGVTEKWRSRVHRDHSYRDTSSLHCLPYISSERKQCSLDLFSISATFPFSSSVAEVCFYMNY